MSKDSLRGLVQLVSGLGDVTVARANQVARDLVNLTGLDDQLGKKKLAAQVQAITQEILKTAEANRAQVAAMVRSEVDSALGRADVARLVDVDAAKASTAMLLSQVEELTTRVRALVPGLSAEAPATPAPVATPAPAAGTAPQTGETGAPARTRPARRSLAGAGDQPSDTGATAPATKKTPARKAPAKKSPAKKSPAEKASAERAPSKTAAATKTTAAKAATTRAPAKTSAAKKAAKAAPATAPAKKATTKKAPTRKSTAKKATGA